jgi:N utilization substance protein B
VLRLALHEWLAEPKTPPRVVLSEALELARAYSGEESVRFVNGVLDAVYHHLKQEGRIID